MGVKIEKIVIRIGEKKVSLTPTEFNELKAAVNQFDGGNAQFVPWYPPYQDPWQPPTITWFGDDIGSGH